MPDLFYTQDQTWEAGTLKIQRVSTNKSAQPPVTLIISKFWKTKFSHSQRHSTGYKRNMKRTLNEISVPLYF